MAITDSAAIKYSNEYSRRAADKFARAYWRSHEVVDRWGSLSGGNQAKLDLMGFDLERAANRIAEAFWFLEKTRLQWDALNMQAVIPNDAGEEVWDNADQSGQDPNRPPITGQDLRRANWRYEEFVNHLKYDPLIADSAPVFRKDGEITIENLSYDILKDVLRMTGEGVDATAFWAGNFVDVCTAIKTEYETTNPSYIQHILAVAPNPGGVQNVL